MPIASPIAPFAPSTHGDSGVSDLSATCCANAIATFIIRIGLPLSTASFTAAARASSVVQLMSVPNFSTRGNHNALVPAAHGAICQRVGADALASGAKTTKKPNVSARAAMNPRKRPMSPNVTAQNDPYRGNRGHGRLLRSAQASEVDEVDEVDDAQAR